MKAREMNIESLLPQRPPMVMLDGLDEADEHGARGHLLVTAENIFTRDGYFTESGLLEAMAQTAAARTSLLASTQDSEMNKKARVGVIGGIKDFRLTFLPRTGQRIETEIELVHEFLNASIVRGWVTVEGDEACTAELKIFLTDDTIS